MTIFIIAILVGMVPMIPAVIFFLRNRKGAPENATRGLLMGLHGFQHHHWLDGIWRWA